MDGTQTLITAAGLSMLLMQLAKWVAQKITKNPTYGFPPEVYAIGIPVLNAVMPWVLFLIGVITTDPILNMTFVTGLQYVIRVALGAVISFMSYDVGVKPLIAYYRQAKGILPS